MSLGGAKTMENYSVLMTVYKNENPDHFREAIISMLEQTVKTNDFVIVCDGPLTYELDNIIYQFVDDCKNLFNIIRLEENHGVGYASRQGVLHCKNELIAKMDSDDISIKTRCEKELKYFENDEDLAIVGSYILEFLNSNNSNTCIRKVPLESAEIYKYSKRRSPFNNPTIMFKKSAVVAVGNYSDLRRCEDFELFARLLHAGYKAANIPECLLNYRITEFTYDKRNNYSYIKKSRKMSRDIGHSSNFDVWVSCYSQYIISKLPYKIRRLIYEKLIRNH